MTDKETTSPSRGSDTSPSHGNCGVEPSLSALAELARLDSAFALAAACCSCIRIGARRRHILPITSALRGSR